MINTLCTISYLFCGSMLVGGRQGPLVLLCLQSARWQFISLRPECRPQIIYMSRAHVSSFAQQMALGCGESRLEYNSFPTWCERGIVCIPRIFSTQEAAKTLETVVLRTVYLQWILPSRRGATKISRNFVLRNFAKNDKYLAKSREISAKSLCKINKSLCKINIWRNFAKFLSQN